MESPDGGPQSGIPRGKHFTGKAWPDKTGHPPDGGEKQYVVKRFREVVDLIDCQDCRIDVSFFR